MKKIFSMICVLAALGCSKSSDSSQDEQEGTATTDGTESSDGSEDSDSQTEQPGGTATEDESGESDSQAEPQEDNTATEDGSGGSDTETEEQDGTATEDGSGASDSQADQEGTETDDSDSAEGELIPPDRRVDWTGNVGIPGGIPERSTVCATVDATTYGNGSTDATAAIQEALDNCPDDEVVLLPTGTYRVTDTIQVQSHRVLRGEGQDATTISYEGPEGGRSGIALSGWPNFSTGETSLAITAGADKGSTTITVASAPDAEVGDLMLIDQLNDGEFVDPNGVEGKCDYCGRADGDRVLGQIVEITEISGNDISFNIPLYWTYSAELSPEATPAAARTFVRWSGVESLTVTQPNPSVTYLIEMQATQYCWLKDVEAQNADWRLVWMLQSLENEIRESYFHESINGYGRSHGYGVLVDMFSSANLVENNIFRTLDGGMMMTAGGAAGNVFGYNYTEESVFDDDWWLTGSPSLNHAPHPMMNLWEANVGYQITGDFIHGSSSHNTVYRSLSRGFQQESIYANNSAVSFATKNTYMNVLGCVLGTEGRSNRYEVLPGEDYSNTEVVIWALGIMHGVDDADVAATLLRHGNYDYVSNDTIWNPAIANQTLPASLYLTAKPAWFGDVSWPPIGPDVTGLVQKLPAELRFEAMPNP